MKSRVLAVVLVAACVLCGGCWDRSEIDQVVIVAGIGIDVAQDSGFKVTLQAASPLKPSGSVSSGGGNTPGVSAPPPMMVYDGTGLTIADAITRGVYTGLTHRAYFAHASVVVIGDEAARRGINTIVDHLLRHIEFRDNMWMLIAKGTAEQVERTPVDHSPIAARGIASIVENEVRVGNARAAMLHRFAENLLDKTRAATTALISVDTHDGEQRVDVVGTAVFKGDRLAGELNQEETRGLMWALGEVKGGSTTVQCRSGGYCSIFLQHVTGKITGKMRDGRPEVNVEVTVVGSADELSGSEDLTEPGTLEFLGEQQSRLVESEIRKALSRAREMDADVFGFGAAVHAGYRGDWKAIERQWDDLFLATQVNIKVNSRIEYPSLMTRPFVAGGSE